MTSTLYPTKEQILAVDPKHRPEILRMVREWKRTEWKEVRRGTVSAKFNALVGIILAIAEEYDKPVSVAVIHGPGCSGSSSYRQRERLILLRGTPSILTAFHELAHHLFGADELTACRWSVHLFRKTFPRAYDRLVWDGHTLRTQEAMFAGTLMGGSNE